MNSGELLIAVLLAVGVSGLLVMYLNSTSPQAMQWSLIGVVVLTLTMGYFIVSGLELL